jgi:hypothetical protein
MGIFLSHTRTSNGYLPSGYVGDGYPLPSLFGILQQMWEVMNCCVCLYNTIIENERKYPVPLSEQAAPYEREGPLAQPNHQVPASWVAFIAMRQEIRDSIMHQQLHDDLVEHIWRLRGNSN